MLCTLQLDKRSDGQCSQMQQIFACKNFPGLEKNFICATLDVRADAEHVHYLGPKAGMSPLCPPQSARTSLAQLRKKRSSLTYIAYWEEIGGPTIRITTHAHERRSPRSCRLCTRLCKVRQALTSREARRVDTTRRTGQRLTITAMAGRVDVELQLARVQCWDGND